MIEDRQHRTADGWLPRGRPSNWPRYRDQVARDDDLGRVQFSLHSHFAAAARALPQVAPRSHPSRSRQVLQSCPCQVGPHFPGPSETEVGRRPVNPSHAGSRSRSRRAYRHISSLRFASRWHMIAVRQAGSFHTGRSAQSPRQRKPISPVTSVAEGQEPRIHADSIRKVHPPAAMAREAVDCGVPSGNRLLSPDVPTSRAAAASSDRDPRPPARPVSWELRGRTAHRVGCGGAFRSGWNVRARPLAGPTYG
jgi:hypothetical protein